MADIPIVPGEYSPDCYPASANAFQQAILRLAHGVIPDIVGVLIQDLPPDDHSQGWIPTAGNIPIYPGYVFVWHATLGHWVSRNPIAASDASRRIFVGLSTDVDTYDGGEAGTASVMAGPMWEIDTAFAGSVPIGVGLIPGSSPAASIATALATTDTLGNSGEYKHVLTGLEGAVEDHVHPMGFGDVGSGDLGLAYETPAVTTPSYTTFFNSSAGPSGTSTTLANLVTLKANDGNGVVSDGHNNLQPFIGVFFLKRTIREFYRLG